jgi:hypothetical protein
MLKNIFSHILRLSARLNNPQITNFETSPLRFEYEIHLQEYRTVRSEMELHLSGRQQIINYELALLAAFFAFSQIVLPSYSEIIRPICFGGSVLFCGFSLLYSWHDTSLIFLASYINHVLRPKLEYILSQVNATHANIFLWEDFQSKNRVHKFPENIFEGIISLGRYSLNFIPGISLLIIGSTIQKNIPYQPWEFTLLIIAIIFAVLTILIALYVLWLVWARIPLEGRPHWKLTG